MNIAKCYVDGSFSDPDIIKWAYMVYNENDILLAQNSGVLSKDPELLSGRQIAGELEGAKQAILWCKNNNYKASVRHDYIGIYCWVKDLFSDEPSWRTNKNYTRQYKQFVIDNREYIEEYIKVKSHSTDSRNNLVDSLAKKAR